MSSRKRRAHGAPSTVRDHWRRITRRFAAARLAFGHGTDAARDEAAWLVCNVLGIAFDELEAALERPVTPALASQLEALADRRIESRAPLAYLLNEAWLDGHRFYVDERVIVPRSHIAKFLGEGLAPWVPAQDSIKRVLDLCTGSGCLGILAAFAFPAAQIDASDLSDEALDVARINVEAYGLGSRVRLVRSDLFAAIVVSRYDVILSNPPYVTEASMRALPLEYRREPIVALAGGRDGLDFVRRIVSGARDVLSADGLLVVEVGAGRHALERAFPQLPFTWLETAGGDTHVFLLRRGELPDSSAKFG